MSQRSPAPAALAIVAAVLAVAIVAVFGYLVYRTPDTVFDDETIGAVPTLERGGDPLLVAVEPGQNAEDIGRVLEDEGIIRSGRLFEILVGLRGVGASLEAGEYEFERGMPTLTVLSRIVEGRTAADRVVIPEGRRAEEVGEILEEAGIITAEEFMAALVKSQYDHAFLAQVPGDRLDGFLFPAGYEFNRSATPHDVVNTLLAAFQENVANALPLEGSTLSLYEVVTLASIIEREAVVPEERPIMASVFLNRLQAGIPLQADPTVQYALTADPVSVEQFGWWKIGVTLEDLEYDSAYNTYVYGGLPPGPICNPGLSSIEAVIRPATTSYLYFVAREDGSHVFAETLDEHLENVAIHQGGGE